MGRSGRLYILGGRENWRREALTALDREGRTGWSPEVWRWREEVPEESLEILS